jgi:MoxR-like ATPase
MVEPVIEKYRIAREPIIFQSRTIGIFTWRTVQTSGNAKGPTGCGKTRFVESMATGEGRS